MGNLIRVCLCYLIYSFFSSLVESIMSTNKSRLRRQAYDLRNAQLNKAYLSHVICTKALSLTDYQKAQTVLWYLHCRSEVQTYQTVITELANQQKKIIIPYCTKDWWGNNHLGLWCLQNTSELVGGTWGILEPPCERWGEPAREVNPEEIDIALVPGVAFDVNGGRIGNGAGYYDRLFPRLKQSCSLVGLGFDCQVFDQVTMQPHDVFMHTVITQTRIYQGRG